MTRWHAASCKQPQVHLSHNKWPFCASCGASCPLLEELVALHQADTATSALSLPPDEPPGQMNLHWPKCVPYMSMETSATAPESTLAQMPQEPGEPAKSMDPPVHIYGPTLSVDEFRVAHVSASPHAGSPVHVTLETCLDDQHPEYETVSYLWGGEDGDSSSCASIFIGEYWDVLLQTRNCSSMLQFMRPRRGERTVWIDALCINQRNFKERAAQVGKMRQIYKNCTRVVAYLGDDLVTKSSSFPHHRTLDQLADEDTNKNIFPDNHPKHGQSFGITELLKRRFFTRIWIVQELILPEQAIFRIGSIDFRTDPRTMSRLYRIQESLPEHPDTPITPWFQHTNQQGFASEDVSDVYTLLRTTQQCQMSDPRDKLFGVIALLQNSGDQQSFAPDYSLSHLHFCVGLFAHWILNRGVSSFLTMAQTLTEADIHGPTWLPAYRSVGFWTKVLSPRRAASRYHESNLKERSAHDQITIKNVDLPQIEGRELCVHSFAVDLESSLAQPPPWLQNSHVNRLTGGLVLDLVHLFTFEEKPRLLSQQKHLGFLFSIQGTSSHQSMALYMFSPVRLDELIRPHQDRLFMMEGGRHESVGSRAIFDDHVINHPGILYLVLRSDHAARGRPLKSKLLTANLSLFEARAVKSQRVHRNKHCVFSHKMSRDGPDGMRLHFDDRLRLDNTCPDPRENIGSIIDYISNVLKSLQSPEVLPLKPVHSEPYSYFLDRAQKHYRLHFSLKGVWQQLLPGCSQDAVLLALRNVFRAALAEVTEETVDQDFSEAIIGAASLQTTISSKHYSIRIPHDQWTLYKNYYLLETLDFAQARRVCSIYSEKQLEPMSEVRDSLRAVETVDEPPTPKPKWSQDVVDAIQFHHYARLPRYYFDYWLREREPKRHEHGDYTLLQLYLALDWEWRPATEPDWCRTADANILSLASRRRRPPHTPVVQPGVDVLVRVRLEKVEVFLLEQVQDLLPPLQALMGAYQPPLSFEQAWEMVLAGPTEEQRRRGVPKVIGGVEMDGSMFQVEIV